MNVIKYRYITAQSWGISDKLFRLIESRIRISRKIWFRVNRGELVDLGAKPRDVSVGRIGATPQTDNWIIPVSKSTLIADKGNFTPTEIADLILHVTRVWVSVRSKIPVTFCSDAQTV